MKRRKTVRNKKQKKKGDTSIISFVGIAVKLHCYVLFELGYYLWRNINSFRNGDVICI